MSIRLAVVVPTRNRAELALRAVQSVLSQRVPGISVLVSDNSTASDDVALLREALPALGVPRLESPGDLAMADHWNWAVDEAQDRARPTHVAFLTDRMIFKDGVLPLLVEQVARRPDLVVSYNHDGILDNRRPVYVTLEPSSWRTAQISTAAFLDGVARSNPSHWATPRMLNCVTPVALLDRLRSTTGKVFGSVSPDYYFAYKVAATVDEFVAWDAPLLVHYALTRSNGHAHQTGRSNADADDFHRRLGDFLNATPFPAIQTLSTAMLHEYAVVAQETGSRKFPALDADIVARLVRKDAKLMAGESARGVLRALESVSPSSGAKDWTEFKSPGRIMRAATYRAGNLVRRAVRPLRIQRLPAWIRNRPSVVPYVTFDGPEEALDVARRTNRVARRSQLPLEAASVMRDRTPPPSAGLQ